MNFSDLPTVLDRSLYDDAMRFYTAKIARRADAVYLIGNVTYPGLSDLDLLVVTSNKRADNAQYFSTFCRLPDRYRTVFHHDPLIVPSSHLEVLAYTTHAPKQLLAGKDVLAGMSFLDSPQERWCKLLEGYCTYAVYVHAIESAGRCPGRRLVAKASSLRFSLRQLDILSDTNVADAYAAEIDGVRSTYFDREPHAALSQIWSAFRTAYDGLTAKLRAVLPLADGQAPEDFARSVFDGTAQFDRISPQYVRERSAAIDRYHEELVRMGLPFGQAFFWEAHGGRGRIFRQSGVHNRVYRVKYRLERMLDAARSS